MVTWTLTFVLFILLLAFGETTVDIYLTKFLYPIQNSENTVKEN